MKPLFVVLLLSIVSFAVNGQQKNTVTGRVLESPDIPVVGAGVYLIDGKDSLRTVTDTAGRFTFSRLSSSKFVLKVRSLGYAPYMKEYDLPATGSVKLDPVFLQEETRMLKNVIVKGNVIPVLVKQDTIEYDARAFKTRDKDRVSELMKLLPGIEVDQQGKLSAMGKKLTKIRVNGKDFFTGNVKEFISKLPADLISKVQVIDDYGDEANFTGIKTGTPKKILNLVTKEGKNSGTNGRVEAGTSNNLTAAGNANYWRDDKQVSAEGGLSTRDNGAGKTKNSAAIASYNDKISKNTTLKTSYNYSGSSADISS